MGSTKLLGFMAIILMVLLPMTINGDLGDDILGKVCDEVECGKGSCVVNTSYPLNFLCECESGWKRTRDEDNDTYVTSFLPCVIPECSLNYGCQPAPPPVPEKDVPHNLSAFDPCYWAYCGVGECTKNRTYTYGCKCNPNYYNLLKISVFPCYSECTLGSDCSRLGIKVANSTSSNGDGTSQGGIGLYSSGTDPLTLLFANKLNLSTMVQLDSYVVDVLWCGNVELVHRWLVVALLLASGICLMNY